jgi:hypothetical protein
VKLSSTFVFDIAGRNPKPVLGRKHVKGALGAGRILFGGRSAKIGSDKHPVVCYMWYLLV